MQAPPWWLAVRRAADEGRACRDYAVFDDAGALLAQARAYPWRREIPILDAEHARIGVLSRRRSFPITGKVDVFDDGGGTLGVLGRDGWCRDADGRTLGRFRDARSMREQTLESLASGVLDAVTGNDGSLPTGPTAMVWLIDGRAAGSLHRDKLPFADPTAPPPSDHPLRRWLPAAVKKRVDGPERAWRFEREAPARHEDLRLLLGAVIFAVELAHW